jgi:hypothetical protein
VCEPLISANPLKAAIQARRQANWAMHSDDDNDHYHSVANPAKGEKAGERGAGPVKLTGYRLGRKSQTRRQGKKKGGGSAPRP